MKLGGKKIKNRNKNKMLKSPLVAAAATAATAATAMGGGEEKYEN